MLVPLSKIRDASHIECDDQPGDYFVSVVDGDRGVLASGPYKTHSEALDNVERVKDIIYRNDPKAPFYGYGTARAEPNSGIIGVIEKGNWQ